MALEAEIRTQVMELTGLDNVTQVTANQTQSGVYAIVTRISGSRLATHTGQTQLNRSRFQISIWGDSYKSVKDKAILAYGLADYTSSNIRKITKENEIDRFENESGKYGVMLDFMVLSYT